MCGKGVRQDDRPDDASRMDGKCFLSDLAPTKIDYFFEPRVERLERTRWTPRHPSRKQKKRNENKTCWTLFSSVAEAKKKTPTKQPVLHGTKLTAVSSFDKTKTDSKQPKTKRKSNLKNCTTERKMKRPVSDQVRPRSAQSKTWPLDSKNFVKKNKELVPTLVVTHGNASWPSGHVLTHRQKRPTAGNTAERGLLFTSSKNRSSLTTKRSIRK